LKLLDDFTLDAIYKTEELDQDSFNFLELSGRKAMYSQGIFGQGVVVAVLDTGVSPHTEFENRLLPGKNCIKNYGHKSWYDDNMHGTHVAGTIAGKICGIAPKAEILPIKVLNAMGGGEWEDIIAGLDYARTWEQKKVKIISMSLSGGAKDISKTQKNKLEEAIKRCVDSGILVVVSAGNTAKDELRYPACFDDVVTVGALDWDRQLAQYSTYGNHVDVVQIGTNVISAYFQGEYAQLSGTSMSTPIISGIAALLVCANQERYKTEITERKLYEALKINTKDLGIKGIDKYFGAGFCTLQPLNMSIETEFGSRIVKFNGEPIEVDVPTQIINGRTLFEMRSFAEKTGAKISWEAENEYHKTRAKFEW
jgi:major intracellular serine protease